MEQGKLVIEKEGRIAKFVDRVDQVSFSGKRARMQGQDVTYVTERCVIRLLDQGLTVTEIAPGLESETRRAGSGRPPRLPSRHSSR